MQTNKKSNIQIIKTKAQTSKKQEKVVTRDKEGNWIKVQNK